MICMAIIIMCISIESKTLALTKSRVLVEQKYIHNITNESNRTSRIYFPIFQMIEFPNEGCLTVDGLMGTCYAKTECDLFKGITRGFCARGFGVCCFFGVSCGGVATNNRTHFLNPKFPHTFNGEMRCEIAIKLPEDICQLRLQFVQLLLSNPWRSQCIIDALTIPYSSKVPVLCGNLTDQHIYLDAKGVKEILIIITTTGKEWQRYWNIEIQFIQCDLLVKAPNGCLQYYTGIHGLVKTFNFDCFRRVAEDGRKECLIANLEYNICIRMESQMCAIEWTPNYFDMGPEGVMASQRGDFCQQNYITIENAKIVTKDIEMQNIKSFDRFCGKALNIDRNNKTSIPLISTAKPFQVGITTAYHFRGGFRGASLSYDQKVCIDSNV